MRKVVMTGLLGAGLMATSVWIISNQMARDMTHKDIDVCMQRQIFEGCMATAKTHAPDSPPSIWSDVVRECRLAGFLMSKRSEDFIKPECRG